MTKIFMITNVLFSTICCANIFLGDHFKPQAPLLFQPDLVRAGSEKALGRFVAEPESLVFAIPEPKTFGQDSVFPLYKNLFPWEQFAELTKKFLRQTFLTLAQLNTYFILEILHKRLSEQPGFEEQVSEEINTKLSSEEFSRNFEKNIKQAGPGSESDGGDGSDSDVSETLGGEPFPLTPIEGDLLDEDPLHLLLGRSWFLEVNLTKESCLPTIRKRFSEYREAYDIMVQQIFKELSVGDTKKAKFLKKLDYNKDFVRTGVESLGIPMVPKIADCDLQSFVPQIRSDSFKATIEGILSSGNYLKFRETVMRSLVEGTSVYIKTNCGWLSCGVDGRFQGQLTLEIFDKRISDILLQMYNCLRACKFPIPSWMGLIAEEMYPVTQQDEVSPRFPHEIRVFFIRGLEGMQYLMATSWYPMESSTICIAMLTNQVDELKPADRKHLAPTQKHFDAMLEACRKICANLEYELPILRFDFFFDPSGKRSFCLNEMSFPPGPGSIDLPLTAALPSVEAQFFSSRILSMVSDFLHTAPLGGSGTAIYDDGQYTGQFSQKGLREGKGTFVRYADGSRYNGSWAQDQQHGEGVLESPSYGVKCVGSFNNGEMGYGIKYFPDGSSCEGDFGSPQNTRIHTFNPNNLWGLLKYEGEISKTGLFNGLGALIYQNGSRWRGTFVGDAEHAEGVLTNSEGIETAQKRHYGLTPEELDRLMVLNASMTEDTPCFSKDHRLYPGLTYASVALCLGLPNPCERLLKQADIKCSQKLWERAFYGFPSDQKWRLFIDVSRQSEGADIFDVEEPGYRCGMERAFLYLRSTLGRRLSLAELTSIHNLCCFNVQNRELGRCFLVQNTRGNNWCYGMASRYLNDVTWNNEEGLPPVSKAACSELESERLIHTEQSIIAPGEYLATWNPELSRTYSNFWTNPTIKQLDVEVMIQRYCDAIKCAKEDGNDKLLAIVKLCRALEIFHIFPDGNQRSIVFVLLNKLLIENGFSPTILRDPNVFDGYLSAAELVKEVKDGIDRFNDLKMSIM